MNTKEQWEEDIQKRVNDIAYSHPKSGKEATENRNKILEIIRETRVDAVGEVYTFVVNHFTNEQEKFEFFKWWSEKYHPNPINEPLSEFNDL